MISCLKLHIYCFVLHSKSPKPPKPKGKANRVWEMGGRNTGELDYSGTNGNNSGDAQNQDYEGSAEPVSSPALMAGDILHFPCSAPLCPHSFQSILALDTCAVQLLFYTQTYHPCH